MGDNKEGNNIKEKTKTLLAKEACRKSHWMDIVVEANVGSAGS